MKKFQHFCLLLLSCSFIPLIVNAQQQPSPTRENEIEKMFSQRGELYFSFNYDQTNDIAELSKFISIDNVRDGKVFAFANRKEFERFLESNIPFTILPPPATEFLDECRDNVSVKQPLAWDFYPTYTAYENMMYEFETTYPQLCRVSNIGTLSSGRNLLVAKITGNVDSVMDKPQFLYSSSLHGDELTCYVNMLRLIDYLLSQYNIDPYVTYLVNNIEIYINPLSNPDGAYHNGNNSVSGATRVNANGVDLNRNFPDPEDGLHPDGYPWQDETVALMTFAGEHHFVMSANFHGGAEVVNYPWDTWSQLPADGDWWDYVSRQFADTIHSHSVSGYFTDLDNGVTNGYAWYTIDGGRQDYMNYWHHCREATIEVSQTKKPAGSSLPNYWNYLYRSLLTYMEQSLYGIRGIVTDSVTGVPLHARIYIAGHDIDSSEVYSHLPLGNYHRLLYPGNYSLTYTCPGYYPKTVPNQTVSFYQTTFTDVQMVPIGTGVEPCLEPRLEVFPNPCNSLVKMVYYGKGGSYKMELMNTMGQRCMTETLYLTDGMVIPLSVSNLVKGIYLCKLSDKEKVIKTAKIVKD